MSAAKDKQQHHTAEINSILVKI